MPRVIGFEFRYGYKLKHQCQGKYDQSDQDVRYFDGRCLCCQISVELFG